MSIRDISHIAAIFCRTVTLMWPDGQEAGGQMGSWTDTTVGWHWSWQYHREGNFKISQNFLTQFFLPSPLWKKAKQFNQLTSRSKQRWLLDAENILNRTPVDKGICVSTLRPRHNGRYLPDIISNAFSQMETLKFSLKFHWRLFLRVQMTIF